MLFMLTIGRGRGRGVGWRSFCLGEGILTQGSQQLLAHGFFKVTAAGASLCVQVDITTFTV